MWHYIISVIALTVTLQSHQLLFSELMIVAKDATENCKLSRSHFEKKQIGFILLVFGIFLVEIPAEIYYMDRFFMDFHHYSR
jgi:hypothetical protein